MKILLKGVRAARDGIPNLSADTVKALVRAGRARGMLVVALRTYGTLPKHQTKHRRNGNDPIRSQDQTQRRFRSGESRD